MGVNEIKEEDVYLLEVAGNFDEMCSGEKQNLRSPESTLVRGRPA